MSDTNPRGIWLWRAWTPNRSRIADCGMVFADSADQARAQQVLRMVWWLLAGWLVGGAPLITYAAVVS